MPPPPCPHCFPSHAGLVTSLGSPAVPSIVQAALQSFPQPPALPAALLHQAHALDQQGAHLLAQRGQGILAGLAGLQAYSAALRLVLGPHYSDTSHHSQWAAAIEHALASKRSEVSSGLARGSSHVALP